MAISAPGVAGHNDRMEKASTTARSAAPRQAGVTRIGQARRAAPQRAGAISRARAARNQLRPRPERFAHLTRMYD